MYVCVLLFGIFSGCHGRGIWRGVGGSAVNLGEAWFLAATVGVWFVEGGLGAGLRPHLHLWFLTVRKLVRQLEDQVCYSRYQISFYLW